jgi:tetratricopeptide (TPR) repeat protein
MIHRHLGPDPIPIPGAIEGTPLGDILHGVTRKNLDDRTITSADVLEALQRVTTLPDREEFKLAPRSSGAPGSTVTPRLSSSWLVPWGQNPNFTGRERAIQWVHDSLRSSRPVSVVALHGLGGVGKTQVALEYAYRHAADYKLVAWIHAEQPESIAAGYADIARVLHLPERPTEREVIESVRAWLERHDEWLLVFDNARNPASIRGHLPRWHRGHILVTSRHPGWRDLAAAFPLDVLERDEAVAFLQRRTGEAEANEPARLLAEELGALPLALEEAAAYIEATGRTLASYLPLLQRRERAPSSSKLHEVLQQTWELSFREIEEQAPKSLDFLKVCAFLGPDDIPDTLFRADDRRATPLPAGAFGDELAFDECVAPLRRYSLVRRERDCLNVHRLVQLATRERLSDEERARYAGAALALVEARYPSKAIAGDSFPESRRLLPHALSVLSHPECDEVHPGLAARVLRRTAIYMSARGLHDRAREQLERALTLLKRAGHADRSQLGATLWELGMVLYAIGEGVEARDVLRQAVVALEGAEGAAGQVFFPQCLVSLAWVERTLGDFEGTIATARRCIEHAERAGGPDHPIVAMSLAPMARAEWSLNRLGDARASVQRAREILDRVEKPLAIVCGTWYALAQVHLDMGMLDGALECSTRGLAVGEPAYGGDHPLVCLNVRITGGVQLRRGELGAARRTLQSAIESGQRACRYLHEDIAVARTELATAAHLEGDTETALSLLHHALDGLDSLCGDPARLEGETRTALSRVLRARGQWAGAVDQSKAALQVLAARYGEAHPLRMAALNALGWALRDGGRGDEANAAFSEAVRIAEGAGLRDHLDHHESLRGLAPAAGGGAAAG